MALETKEWLVWLGVRDPSVDLSKMQADIGRLKDSVGDWEAFEDLVEGAADYSSLEQDLIDAGFPSDKVDAFISKLQDRYSSYTEMQDAVVDSLNDYDEFRAQFGNTQGLTGADLTEDGEPTAGMRVHDEAGTSYGGVSVPAGTTEVFGRRIEFTQQDAAADPDQVGYDNLETDSDTNTEPVFFPYTISADVTNPNGWGVDVAVPLKVDGAVQKQQDVRLPANGTVNVEFEVQRTEYQCLDVSIGTLDPVLICWDPSGLQPSAF